MISSFRKGTVINMKRITAFLLCLFVLATLVPLSVGAITPIDPARPSSLTLHYVHNGKCFEGLEIKSYRVAEVYENGTYELTGAFSEYPVKIYEVTSQAEWKKIASTLAAYAAADGIEPTCIGVTDENGVVSFKDILPGMYLTVSVTVHDESGITFFENFLTVVPYPSEDGDHNYDVTAYPKSESRDSGEEQEYKVVKQWKDSGFEDKRPHSVTVEILRNGVVHATETLSPNNNWSYRWTAEDDGSIWQVVERGIPEDYTVTVTREHNTFVITNCTVHDIPGAPQTGDTAVLWVYQLAMCISGGVLLILAAWRKKNEA